MGILKCLFYKITGGRPMKRLGYFFTDQVSGEPVYFYLDRFGREWLSTGAWSGFRVKPKKMTFKKHIQGICDILSCYGK